MKKRIPFVIIWAFVIWAGPPLLAPAQPLARVRLEAPDRNSDELRFEEIERKLKELIGELERLQKEASQKLRKEVIPYLEREIDRLKEWLRDFRLDRKKEPETRKT